MSRVLSTKARATIALIQSVGSARSSAALTPRGYATFNAGIAEALAAGMVEHAYGRGCGYRLTAAGKKIAS